MQITFWGAVGEVTGSMHLFTNGEDRILFDCGLFQGRRNQTNEKNRRMPVDPGAITNLLLSHAHIDHSGRIPLLVKEGFMGRIICTRATADVCEYLLMDAAHIQESDADYLNYKAVRKFLTQPKGTSKGKQPLKPQGDDVRKMLKKGRHRLHTEKIEQIIKENRLKGVYPLYRSKDAKQALGSIDGYPYLHPISIGTDITCTFYDAGHILGSALSMIQAKANGRTRTVCYTGDVGRFGKPIIKDPTLLFSEQHREVDLLILESTYGNRVHAPMADLKPRLKQILNNTAERGGSVLIPAFAYGRTQELLYVLHQLYEENEVPKLPVYIDSPLATKITRVFGEHPENYDQQTHEDFLKNGQNPFAFKQLHFVESVEASMALNRDETPHIVLSASGMCEAGRILHHLRHKIHNPRHTILLVGYMAQHTLGRRIMEQGLDYTQNGRKGDAPLLKILGKTYPLKARVAKLEGFSAHADREEMLRFLKESNLTIKRIALVHGEQDQTLAFAELLRKEGYTVSVPGAGESIHLV